MTSAPGDLSALGGAQAVLVFRAGAFLGRMARRGVDVARDPECYLNSWADGPGHARLRRMAFGWREEPHRLFTRAKDVLWWLRISSFAVSRSDAPSAFDNIVVSWTRGADFDASGNYTDRYTRLMSTNTPRTLWFLVSLDGVVPSRLASNVRVFHQPLLTRGASDAGAVSVEQKAERKSHRRSGAVAFAEAIAAAVRTELQHGRCSRVVMPYEAQPFQHAVNLAVKAHDSRIVTVGYLHSVLPALPTDLIYRAGAPDRLLVHGAGQRDILTRYLGWPAERVDVIPSLRYRSGDDAPLAGRMLLPYAFDDEAVLLQAVEECLEHAPVASMPRWQVRNHPVRSSSPRHLRMVSRLEALLEKHSNRLSDAPARPQAFMVGATAAVIEGLERGLDVVHVCANPLFETHTPEIWSDLEVESVGRHAFRYHLRVPTSYIALGRANEPAAAYLGLH